MFNYFSLFIIRDAGGFGEDSLQKKYRTKVEKNSGGTEKGEKGRKGQVKRTGKEEERCEVSLSFL